MNSEVLKRMVDKGDAWINPIVVKELRQAMRSRFVILLVMLFLLVQIVALAIYLLNTDVSGEAMNFYAGRELFETFMVILLVAGIVCIPAYAAARLSSERTDINVDLIFITALPPRMIISGKFLATMMLAVLIYSACMPFMTFTYILRGIDLPTIAACLGFSILMIAFCIQAAIFCGCMAGNKYVKSLLGLSFIGGLFTALGMSIGFCDDMIRRGVDSPGFLEVAATATVLILLGTAGLYMLSVAAILPPSANRALPVRLFILVAWLVGGGLALYWALEHSEEEAIGAWCLCSVVTFCAGLLMSISERDTLGVRVTRQIPRSSLLRRGAFLLYSGAAGGVIFCSLLITVTLISSLCLFSLPSLHLRRTIEEILAGSAGMALSVFSYAMLAVLVRRLFWPKKLPHSYLWAVTLVLMVAGMVGPLLISAIVVNSPLLWIGNPFTGFFYSHSYQQDAGSVFFAWVIVWSVILAVVNLPWFVGQIRAFRPYADTERA